MRKLSFVVFTAGTVLTGSLLALQMLIPRFNIFQEFQERTPGEMLRYVMMRLDGHSKLEAVFDPPLYRLQKQLEPPIEFPLSAAQTYGKGQQTMPLPAQDYSAQTQPQPMDPLGVYAGNYPTSIHKPRGREWLVTPDTPLSITMSQARAGDTITLQPGTYTLAGVLATKYPGRPDAPIHLRAEQPDTVHIRTSSLFYVTQPYWVFENLNLEGNCRHSGGPCEHAFHVVGTAVGTVIRNNHLLNFYAHIKVNGVAGKYPDKGLVQFNTFSNDANYGVKGALAPFDLVGASDWVFTDNLVHHFVKAWSPNASYGIFMKGGGSRGRIERNMVVCTGDGAVSHYGSRVGISMGGGLTEARFCQDKQCLYEHADGLIANNLVMNCNDFGIDNNRSIRTVAAHNTLFNTYGIDARGIPSNLLAYGNYLSGYLRPKQGGELQELQNDTSLSTNGTDTVSLLLPQNLFSDKTVPTHPLVTVDFCGERRASESNAGALTHADFCGKPRSP